MRTFVLALMLSVVMVLLAATSSLAVLPTMWEKQYGGPYNDVAHWIENTSDGGFIMVGTAALTDTTSQDVWLVKMNAHGDTVWSRHYGGSDHQSGEAVVEAPGGGYLAVGTISYEASGLSDVYLLRVNEFGDSLWAKTNGYVSWDYAYGVTHAYEGGYVIVGVADVYGTGYGDVILTKVDADGNWENNVILGGSETDWAMRIRQTSDGGYIVVGGTRSYGYGLEDVYLMKFNGARVLEWQQFYGGTGWDTGYDVRETSDGGFIVAGSTPHGFGSDDAFLVKTDVNGDSIWTRNYGGPDYDDAISIAITYDGNYVFVGQSRSWSSSMDIYMQMVSPDGSPGLMATYGGTGYDAGYSVQITPDDGLVVAGRLDTATMGMQAYAMRTLGYSPRIWTVWDVPDDQGGQMRVCWFRSAYDEIESPYPIYEYSIWRRIDPLPLVPGTMGSGMPPARPVVLGGTEFPPGDWDYVTSVPALGENEYCCVVPTLCDWTVDHGICWSVFFVAAETIHPARYFVSPPDSGCSIDNLEPSPPAGLHMPTPADLAWDEALEDDFDHFAVYGSWTSNFEDAEFISVTEAPALDVSAWGYGYYHVTSLDHAGNESAASTVENTYADVRGDALPGDFALLNNHPNPFESMTLVGFDMPRRGHVMLEVIDVSGRLVRTLVDEVRPAERHWVTWDGRDGAGVEAGPGIYFVRMEAGDFTDTKKMMLLR